MKYVFRLGILAVIGIVGWRLVGQLDPQAISMAVGILFGVLAGLPVSLLIIASQRRQDEKDSKATHRPSAQTINTEWTVIH